MVINIIKNYNTLLIYINLIRYIISYIEYVIMSKELKTLILNNVINSSDQVRPVNQKNSMVLVKFHSRVVN